MPDAPVYTELPESVCFHLRGLSDGLVEWEDDIANNCIRLRVKPPVGVTRSQAHDYMMAWRKSGVWALRGFEEEAR